MVNMKLISNDTEGIVLMSGRLDSQAAPEAEKILRTLPPRFEKLTLDFTKMEYISSAGLRILKILHSAMIKKSGKLVLKNVNPMIMEVFDLVGFSALLNFE